MTPSSRHHPRGAPFFLLGRRSNISEVGWTKPDPAATTERKSTSVATNRHSSGTDQHLDMDEEGRRRSERNRTRQTAAAGPRRLPATVATGTGSTSLGGSDDATTSQDGVAGQDSERSDTDTVGQRIPLAGPANVPPTIQTGLYGPTGDLSGLQTIVQEAVQAAVRGVVAGMADLLRPATQRTHDPRPPAESGKLVPVFNPVTNPVQTVEHWIRKVDELSAIYSWTEIQTACFALTKLEGIAKTWYDGLVSVQRSWLEWKLELKKAFPPVVNLQRRHQEMEARRKLPNETVEQYFHEKLSLARLCQLPEDQIVDYVITGISDEALVRSLSVVKFSTPEDLLECLKRLDDRLTAVGETSHRSDAATSSRAGKNSSPSDRNADRLPKRRPPFNSNGEPRCFNCDEYGHMSVNCSKPNKREHCSECHRTGHKTTDCRSSGSGSVSAENHHIENKEQVNAQNEKYFQDALVDGKLVRAYVDLGSQCVTLRKVDADNLGINYNQPSRGCKIGGYGFGQVLPCGITEASVTVDHATARVPIYVVPSEAQAIPLLVGQPFTEQPHVTIVRRRNTLRIFEEQGSSTDDDERLQHIQVPDLPPRSLVLWAKESVVIPSNCVGIIFPTTKESAAGHVFVDAQLQMQEGKEHCLPACVINVKEGGDTVLPILNMSSSNVDISKGDVAARGSWCSETPETTFKRSATDLLEPIKAEDVRTGPQLCPDLWRRYHLTTEDGPICSESHFAVSCDSTFFCTSAVVTATPTEEEVRDRKAPAGKNRSFSDSPTGAAKFSEGGRGEIQVGPTSFLTTTLTSLTIKVDSQKEIGEHHRTSRKEAIGKKTTKGTASPQYDSTAPKQQRRLRQQTFREQRQRLEKEEKEQEVELAAETRCDFLVRRADSTFLHVNSSRDRVFIFGLDIASSAYIYGGFRSQTWPPTEIRHSLKGH
ncbi:hypothetical protein HPB47_004871 [Ixodes persulcatus]|uniref:Uncharacterized protein n=1 Tax=Ixodes persulcatus TaxID=34615 RepID=A0AC60PEK6_IXOPE|nr:hypothetical protein HPB47_004871 [Ixodes persulcatus]